MLGKDYMLAIILVNCDDDLWGDQSLEGEPGLPPGWRKIHDAAGTYYWHVPSGSTQWQRPTWESGDAEGPCTRTEGIWGLRPPKGRSFSSLESSLDQSNTLSCYGEEFYIQNMEPGAKCFAVRSLGWVEVPEEDLVPGKSSIAVNNCIQQLAQTRSRSQPPDGAWGEGQNMLMILKKDAMSLVNPLDHSLIHCQPLVHIRVWGVGSSKGRDRDFAFVAGDKDSCMLKCHVFRCDVPAKAIASALHGLCAQILSERVGVGGDSSCCSLDPISPDDLPRQVELLDAVSQAAQKYEALYMGTLPVTKAMGMDVLNEAIGILTTRGDRDTWVPAVLSVSDSLMTAHPIKAEADAEEEPLWQCPVRLVTFIGVGRDPHTFGLIADLGRQSFQCAAFWCQPHAGGLSEAVQAACMLPENAVGAPDVDYQPHIRRKPWPVPCPAEAFREPEAEKSWILTYPFSLGSVPEVSCGLCSSWQGLGCPGPCPPAAQADQLRGLPRSSPASPCAQRRGWGCSPSKAGHLLFSRCLPAETLSAPYVLN